MSGKLYDSNVANRLSIAIYELVQEESKKLEALDPARRGLAAGGIHAGVMLAMFSVAMSGPDEKPEDIQALIGALAVCMQGLGLTTLVGITSPAEMMERKHAVI